MKCYQTVFEYIGKSSKTAKFDLFRILWTLKITFRAIQSNPSFDSSLVPSLGSFVANREKVSFRTIQPNPYFTVHLDLPNNWLHAKKKKKSYQAIFYKSIF